jgi:hypothetical protein
MNPTTNRLSTLGGAVCEKPPSQVEQEVRQLGGIVDEINSLVNRLEDRLQSIWIPPMQKPAETPQTEQSLVAFAAVLRGQNVILESIRLKLSNLLNGIEL